MKIFSKFSILFLALLLALFCSQSAYAAKTLQMGSGSVNNTGTEAERTVSLDINLTEFTEVNGLTFTITYDDDVFDFKGIEQKASISLSDGENNVPQDISDTIFYHANSSKPGLVLVAAAAAEYLTQSADTYVPFTASFVVKPGKGSGVYPIRVLPTVIGPATALSAGYTESTTLPVAVGLAPTADPSTATSYTDIALNSGSITVSGGYEVSGTVKYPDTTSSNNNSDGIIVKLKEKVDELYYSIAETSIINGEFSFPGIPSGDYKIVVKAIRHGYQKEYTTGDFTIGSSAPAPFNITLVAYSPITGKITIDGKPISGVKVKVMDGDTLVGYYGVDPDTGVFITPPLDPSVAYTLYAVYGSQETLITAGIDKNWSLNLGSVAGTISGVSSGQKLKVYVSSDSKGIEKLVKLTASSTSASYKVSDLIPADDYIISVWGEGIPVTYYDNVTSFSEATPVAVTAKQSVTGKDFAFASTGVSLTGTIKDNETPVEDVTVYALESETGALFSTKSEATTGNFDIKVPEGEYYVFASKDNKNFYSNGSETSRLFEEAKIIVADSDGFSGIEINIHVSDAVIKGRVSYKRIGGLPVSGILVKASGPMGIAFADTDENGNYQITGLEEADYKVTIEPEKPWSKQSKENIGATTAGTVCDFVIDTGWELKGQVIDKITETGIENAHVFLRKYGANDNVRYTSTKTGGNFTIADIEGGLYSLYVDHSDYLPFPADGEEGDKDIYEDTDMTGDSAIKLSAGAVISGTVKNSADNQGVVGATVMAVSGGLSFRTMSADGGAFEFKGLPTGRKYFIITQMKAFYKNLTETVSALTDAGIDNLEIPLDPITAKYTVQGHVKSGEVGNPGVSGVTVKLASDKYYDFTQTGTDGLYTFNNVPGDTYKIIVFPGKGQPRITGDLDVNGNIDNHVITLPIGFIMGEVTLADGTSDKTINVYLLDSSNNVVGQQKALFEGGVYKYRFDKVSGSGFKVIVNAAGYTSGVSATVNSGATVDPFSLNVRP